MDAVFGGLEATGLALSGSITSVDGSAPTAGQLLIGHGTNGDMALATLTAGEGIDVTNADGSITIASEVGTASNLGAVIVAAGEGMDASSINVIEMMCALSWRVEFCHGIVTTT